MKRELFGAGLKVALVRMAGMGAGFLVTVLLARTLGPDGLGLYAYALSLLALAAVPVNNGWATVLLREASQGESGPRWTHVRGMILWGARASALSALFAFLIAMVARHIFGAGAYSAGTITLLAFVLFFDQLSGLRLSVLRGLNFPVWGQVPEMLVRPALIVLFFLLLIESFPRPVSVIHGFMSLCAASLLTAILGVVILRWKAPPQLAQAKAETHLKIWFYSAGLLAGNAWLVILNSQIDFLMLGALSEAKQLGYYRVAMQIALFSGVGYAALNMIAMQRFSKLLSAGKMAELQAAATFMSRIAFATTLPVPLVFWVAGEGILAALFGPEYSAAVNATLLLLAAQSVSASFGFCHTLLVMGKNEKVIIPLTAMSVALNFAACTILIPIYQMVGAAMAALISALFWNVALWMRCHRLIKVNPSVFS